MTNRSRVPKGVSTGGRYAAESRGEDFSVQLASKPWSPPEKRYADTTLEHPLEAYEVGQRLDDQGRINGLVPVDMEELSGHDDDRDTKVGNKLAENGGGHLKDFQYQPRGVDSQGRILMEVSANADELIDRSFGPDDLSKFDQGLSESRLISLDRLPSHVNIADGSQWVATGNDSMHDLRSVPPLPKEISAETFSLDFDDDGNPMASVELDSGEYLYAYARDDGYGGIETRSNAQSGEVETGLPPEALGQTLIHLESVAYNQMAIEREAVAMLRQNKSFMSKAQQVAVAGQQ